MISVKCNKKIMTRKIAEQSNALSIFWLKKNGFLNKDCSHISGGIKWTYGISGKSNNISFSVVRNNQGTPQEKTYLNLRYTSTDRWSGEKTDMNYNIDLVTTPCHYGGERYWFVCPLHKNGVYCGKRVGVIYNIGKWFGCRNCGEIAYQAQFEGGKFRFGSVTEPDVEKAYSEIKRKYYNGKPTRKYRRYLRLRDKMDNSWFVIAGKIGMKF